LKDQGKDPNVLEMGMWCTDDGYRYWCAGHVLPMSCQSKVLMACVVEMWAHFYDSHHGRILQLSVDTKTARHMAMAFRMRKLAQAAVHRATGRTLA
jgi:hypothetical protein